MEEDQIAAAEAMSAPVPLTYAWGAYAAAATVLWIFCALNLWGLAVVEYFVAGFVLTRLITRRLISMHPMYNTIANEFSAKIGLFLFWPLQVLLLLLKMSVNRVL